MPKNRTVISFFGLSLALILVSVFILFFGLSGSRGELVVSFTSAGTVNLLGNLWTVALVPITALIVVLVNLALAYEVYNRERFLSYILGSASLFFSVLALVLSWIIVSVN